MKALGSKLSTEQLQHHQKVAAQVADIGLIVCMAIFAVCFIAAIVLGVFAFGIGIIAIPSAIGILVFLVPAISRIISISLEYQTIKRDEVS